MKRNSFKWCVYTFLFLGIGMVSCADEDLMTYEDVPRIYFKYADASSSDFGENEDQITVNMGYDRFARIRLASNENFHTDYSTSRYDK